MQSILFFPHLALDVSDANVQRTKRRVVIEENNYAANTFARNFLTAFSRHGFGYNVSQNSKRQIQVAEYSSAKLSQKDKPFMFFSNPATREIKVQLPSEYHNQIIAGHLFDHLGSLMQRNRFLAGGITKVNSQGLSIDDSTTSIYYYKPQYTNIC